MLFSSFVVPVHTVLSFVQCYFFITIFPHLVRHVLLTCFHFASSSIFPFHARFNGKLPYLFYCHLLKSVKLHCTSSPCLFKNPLIPTSLYREFQLKSTVHSFANNINDDNNLDSILASNIDVMTH